jgi:hypothetical protein
MNSLRSMTAVMGFAMIVLGAAAARGDDAASNAAAAPPPADAAPATPPPTAPPSITVIEANEAHSILGRYVRSPAKEDMGRLVDVIVDRSGTPRGAVIDFGGFLGVGSRRIVVDWSALRFWSVTNKSESITLDLSRDQVKAAPEYKEDQPIVVLGASGNLEPLQFPPDK